MTATTRRRRAVLGAIAAAWVPWPLAARAATLPKTKLEAKARLYRIGALCATEIPPYFWEQLRALGYEEHRSLEIAYKDVDAGGNVVGIAAALAAANVDVSVACTNDEAIAAMRATARTPVVLLHGVAPVEAGLIAPLARPGGNVTGAAAVSPELVAKSLGILKSALPSLQRVATIVNFDDPAARILYDASARAARELGASLAAWPVVDPAGLEKAFAAIAGDRPDGLLVNFSVFRHLMPIIDFAARERLPAMYPIAPAVARGGLLSYSPHRLPQLRRNAEIVDRIRHGAQPRDNPVEQLGLTIPSSLLPRATVIE